MKPLRPITILAGAPLVGVAVVSVAALLWAKVEWTARAGYIWFGVGTVTGALVLAPIAAGEAFRDLLAVRLEPYALRIEWYTSINMGIAFGYILAAFDGWIIIAWGSLFIGAMIKVAMGTLFDSGLKGIPIDPKNDLE